MKTSDFVAEYILRYGHAEIHKRKDVALSMTTLVDEAFAWAALIDTNMKKYSPSEYKNEHDEASNSYDQKADISYALNEMASDITDMNKYGLTVRHECKFEDPVDA